MYVTRDSWYDKRISERRKEIPIMPRYVIDLDADSITELLDAHPADLSLDVTPDATDALLILAAAALGPNFTFTNVEIVPSYETIFFAATVTLAFDATAADVAAYLAYYDADPDYAIPYADYLRLRPTT